MNDDYKVTEGTRRDVKSMDLIPAELVRKILEYLREEELPFALTSKVNLTYVRSLRKDRILPMQRQSVYLRSRDLTAYILAHGMTSVPGNIMHVAAKHGCLEGIMILRAREPPCPWDEWTCWNAAEGGHLDVLQWLCSQDPPCPLNEWRCERESSGCAAVAIVPGLSDYRTIRGMRATLSVTAKLTYSVMEHQMTIEDSETGVE